MKLNKLEFIIMNSPIRGIIQEKYAARILRSMSSVSNIEMALEIGCGNGTGTRIIKKLFYPENVIGIDMDKKMIEKAQRRHKDQSVIYKVMDAANMEFPDHSFDAIFDFGMIHHIPDWKKCIKELYRVLKPGGEVILEDLSIESFSGRIGKVYTWITDHPYKEMYSVKEFTDFLTESGFIIEHYKELNPLGLVRLFFLNARKR